MQAYNGMLEQHSLDQCLIQTGVQGLTLLVGRFDWRW